MSNIELPGTAVAHGCRTMVREILASRRSRSCPDGMPPETVIRRLFEVPAECGAELRATARQLLAGLPHSDERSSNSVLDEGHLHSVLEALTWRQDPQAPTILLDTLTSPDTMLKEEYVSMLEDLDHADHATDALLAVLADGLENHDRCDLSVTIRALHSLCHEPAVPWMLAYVSHPDRAVRGNAIAFLYDFDDGNAAGPVFADQLDRERDADCVDMLICGLIGWGRFPDIQLLRRLAEDSSQPKSLRKTARRAIAWHPKGETPPSTSRF